jgi:hypothetical protein
MAVGIVVKPLRTQGGTADLIALSMLLEESLQPIPPRNDRRRIEKWRSLSFTRE